MGNKFIIDNLLWQPGVEITPATGDASGLLGKSLFPGYRSGGDKALSLNGIDEYAHSSDADFGFTTQFAIETYIVNENEFVSSHHTYASKSDYGTLGYIFRRLSSGVLSLWLEGARIDSDPLPSVADAKVKAIYIGSQQLASIWLNDVEIVRAEAGSITVGSGSLIGTIPTSINAASQKFALGAAYNGSASFDGTMGHLAIKDSNVTNDNSSIDAEDSAAYWDFENEDLQDSSGNDHSLTGVGIDSSNYVGQYTNPVSLQIGGLSNTDKKYLYIDRRHNLSTGSTVEIFLTDPLLGENADYSRAVTADTAIIFDDLNFTESQVWIQFTDSSKVAEDFIIPCIYLAGDEQMLETQRSFLSGYSSSSETLLKVNESSSGTLTSYVNSPALYSLKAKWRASQSEFATLKNVISYASDNSPILFSPDGSSYYSVYVKNAARPNYNHIKGDRHFVDLDMREIG
jgi:hypothetical protein